MSRNPIAICWRRVSKRIGHGVDSKKMRKLTGWAALPPGFLFSFQPFIPSEFALNSI